MVWGLLRKLLSPSVPFSVSEVYPCLFLSSKISKPEDVAKIHNLQIDVVIDLEGGFDVDMPFLDAYLYWPILDVPVLPDECFLFRAAQFAYISLKEGQKVLVHCRQGLNRSGLVCGKIMRFFGLDGPEIISRIREKVPGALFNPVFAKYIEGLR